jgi:hypothetical protein
MRSQFSLNKRTARLEVDVRQAVLEASDPPDACADTFPRRGAAAAGQRRADDRRSRSTWTGHRVRAVSIQREVRAPVHIVDANARHRLESIAVPSNIRGSKAELSVHAETRQSLFAEALGR